MKLFVGEGKGHAEVGEKNKDNQCETTDAEDEREDTGEGVITIESISKHETGDTDGGEDEEDNDISEEE